MNCNVLRKAINHYRLFEKISLVDAAREIGISRDAVYRFETGQEIESKALAKIIQWLLK
jgi:predicted transcriptional regulator